MRKTQEQGLIIMDQVEEQNDIRFVRKLERYFVKTTKGTQRADWIVPAPFFSSSYLSVPIQVADVCIYCINWGFRRPTGKWMHQRERESNKTSVVGFSDWSIAKKSRKPMELPRISMELHLYKIHTEVDAKERIKKRRQNPSRRPQGLPVRPSLHK